MAVSQGSIIESMEQICSNLNPNEFIYSFLDAYGFPKSTVTRLRNGDGTINVAKGEDIALRKQLYFCMVEAGTDVSEQADLLKASDLIARHDIRFVIATDFADLVAYDLKANERLDIPFSELASNYAFFLPLAGYEKAVMYSEHPADLKASEKMGQLFDLIRERNELTQPQDIHALNVFLTRLLFCFYAEDTGIFDEGQFTYAIQSYTQADGSDLDQFFTDLFTVLNLAESSPERQKMPAHFQAFKFVNGGLFRDDEPVPEFGRKARRILLDCAKLDWSEINPDIFGSMFQAVIDEEQRGNLGQHYTSVSNIMKVIQPLFLDPLYAELDKCRGNEAKLKALLLRISELKIFDPACGSGNFLIIAYKELRRFEMQVVDALSAISKQSVIYYSGIRLNQFYGIEIDDFASEVATLALWLAEHQMNMEFKVRFGYAEAALPLKDGGNVICGNSLRMDWEQVCPPTDGQGNQHEVYVLSNPPFLGKQNQSKEQRQHQAHVTQNIKSGSDLDYVACWFLVAAGYISRNGVGKAAFVATNSICQGEQVSILWKEMFRLGMQINFAFTPFTWSNAARNKAAVHCVIVGFGLDNSGWPKYIYDGDHAKAARNISPYLVEASNTIVEKRSSPLCESPLMSYGNKPTDDGNLILTEHEKNALIDQEPGAKKWIRRFIGSREFINSLERWCLWLVGISEQELESLPAVHNRVEAVRKFRLKSTAKPTIAAANTPELFFYISHPATQYIVIPETSSERRSYIPIGYANSDTICSNAMYMLPEPSLYALGIITSEMHNDWMRMVAGRLESRYRYSASIVYNTFPWPDASEAKRKHIEELAEEVILTREDYPTKTLAELYDPDKMPEPLLQAHKALDRAVEALYRERPFRDASERLEHLFGRYEKLIAAEKTKGSK